MITNVMFYTYYSPSVCVCALNIVKNVLGSEAYLKYGEKESGDQKEIKSLSTSTAGLIRWFGLRAQFFFLPLLSI